MDLLLIGAAIATGMAGFYVVLGLQDVIWGPRRAIRARTLDDPHPTNVIAPLRTRRLSPDLIFSADKTELNLIRAGWQIKVGEYRLLRLLFAILVGVLAVLLTDAISFGPPLLRLIVVFLAGVIGSALPAQYVGFRKGRRLNQIDDQLPIALTSMSKSLLAGTGLLQAMDYAAEQTPVPLGPELQRTISDLRLGGDAAIVFGELSRRVGSSNLDIATTAIMIQRTVGGNLSEILNNASETIRERHQIQAEVRVLTSRQRLTGNIVGVIPVLVAGAFFVVNPTVANLLITETAGRIALTFAIAMELFGLWLIGRLAIIEV